MLRKHDMTTDHVSPNAVKLALEQRKLFLVPCAHLREVPGDMPALCAYTGRVYAGQKNVPEDRECIDQIGSRFDSET
jgi:hypothetical protein